MKDDQPRAAVGWRAAPWFMLAVLTCVNAINWADRQVVPILFPAIRSELGLTDTQLGVVGGLAFSMIYAISAFAFGRAADRSIRRNLIVGGLVVWSVATAASGLADGFGSLFAARFFTGIGEASLYPCAVSLISERFPAAARGKAMGIFGAAAAVGSGVGIGLGGGLAESAGWRTVFFYYGGVGLLFVPLLMLVREDRRPSTEDHKVPFREVIGGLLGDVRLVTVWISGMIMIGCAVGYSAWVPSYFVRERGFEVSEAGRLFGFGYLAGGVVGSLLGGYFVDRRRRVRFAGDMDVSAACAFIAVPIVLITLLVDSPIAYTASAILGPVAIFAYFPALQTILADLVPQRRLGLAYAVHILFLGGIGSAAGPFVIGAVSDAAGSLLLAMYVPIVGMVAAGLLAWYSGTLIRRLTPPDG